MPATIDDPAVLDQIKVATAEWKKTLKWDVFSNFIKWVKKD
jgi:hypothetical protein